MPLTGTQRLLKEMKSGSSLCVSSDCTVISPTGGIVRTVSRKTVNALRADALIEESGGRAGEYSYYGLTRKGGRVAEQIK